MASRRTKINHPSFKILFGDYSTKLRVLPAFVKNLKEENLPLDFTVSVRSLVGTSWMVKVEGSYDDIGCRNYYFTKGWWKMVKDLELAESDFLVFYLVAEDELQHAVYDPTGCQKKITLPTTSSELLYSKDSIFYPKDNARRSQPDPESKNPICQVVISRGYLSGKTLSIPASYMRSNFNPECHGQILTLETEGGGSWPVNLHNYQSSRAQLCGGFTAFLRDNALEVGDFCTFELIDSEQKVFMVSICRGGG